VKAGTNALNKVNAINKATVDDKTKIDAAIQFLNLNQHQSFIVSEKVLEYKLAEHGLNLK
jgi:hypothetical protein